MTDHRKHMNPYHLEVVLFLNYNKSLWNASSIQECIDEERIARRTQNQNIERYLHSESDNAMILFDSDDNDEGNDDEEDLQRDDGGGDEEEKAGQIAENSEDSEN